LAISAGSGPYAPTGSTSHGSYSITINGVSYGATLSSRELASTLRALNVTIAWASRHEGTALDKSFGLTTYVLLN